VERMPNVYRRQRSDNYSNIIIIYPLTFWFTNFRGNRHH